MLLLRIHYIKGGFFLKELLYYQDVMLRKFDATVISKGTDENGRNFIVLSNTAFYPTGGGQPHDTGTINGIEVIDVEKVGDEIRHYIQGDVSILNGDARAIKLATALIICSNMQGSIY